jgi:transcription termination factor NusB
MGIDSKILLAALQEIFELDIKGKDKKAESLVSENPVVLKYIENKKKIDELISWATGKNIKIIPSIERDVLRVLVAESLLGVDEKTLISHAVKLSKKYLSTNFHKFVVAILYKISEKIKDLEQEEKKKKD